MIKLILILIIIAAGASLVGLPRLAGTASAAARFLIFVALALFLLVMVGLVSIA